MNRSNPYQSPSPDESSADQTVDDLNEHIAEAPTDFFADSRQLERRVVWWSTGWFFFTLLSYSIVRPIRETMGAIGGTKQLQGLMLVTFVVMLFAVPAYSALVNRLPRRWLVRVIVHFFSCCLLFFSFAQRSDVALIQVWSARAFFVWVNVFALVGTSVFWSVLADIFNSSQAKRLFGRIAAGGTVGAITGSFLASQVATLVSLPNLVLIPVVTLQMGLWFAWRTERSVEQSQAALTENTAQPQQQSSANRSNGDRLAAGGLWEGIAHVLKSPYLLSICLFLFFVQASGTQMYFQQAEIVGRSVVDDQEKIRLFAWIDFATQVLTLFAQTVLSGLILRKLGVAVALCVLPLIYFVSFTVLSFHADLMVVAVAMVVARATAYGITVPSREVLFTVVSREDKYKSKNFIDTVVLRGGDATAGQLLGSLKNFAGISFSAVNLISLPVIAVWMYAAYRLGKRQRKLALSSIAVGNAKDS
ncbi:NTP/NDP exchange transporter [Roseiconus lacunae]|uniref:NTP/NDP exchange transporter n=1 Tax=Roseiconus lacunae TaxID=2605694 RepID=UPI001E5A72FD|nr:MFS transporter [Roseiconus lacunae]MCD0459345.1 MFS transporter [Roseiconus lacunae]